MAKKVEVDLKVIIGIIALVIIAPQAVPIQPISFSRGKCASNESIEASNVKTLY